MSKDFTISNWKKTLVYGNYQNNYHHDDIDEDIIHTQYIGDCDELVLVKSHIHDWGVSYYNYQIWSYTFLDEYDGKDNIELNSLIKQWEK
jgi:hypothetical protein